MKNFKVKAFGMLTEKLPAPEFEFPYYKSSKEFLNALNETYPQLKSLHFSLAINKQLAQENSPLSGGEEIALLPPFSGG